VPISISQFNYCRTLDRFLGSVQLASKYQIIINATTPEPEQPEQLNKRSCCSAVHICRLISDNACFPIITGRAAQSFGLRSDLIE
jgi:hypothetical protein